jgi:hypothetical protein
VEQASCLFKIFKGGQDAHPTIKLNYGGTGILPVAEFSTAGKMPTPQ